MYLPKTKYTVSIAKPGMYLLNGETYVGPVISTYTGELYAGDDIRDIKGTLVKVIDDIHTEYPIVPIKRVPTEAEYKAGYITRYFCQDKRTLKVFEVSDEDYTKGKDNKELSYYAFIQLTWYLTGSGAITYNRETMVSANKILPGIVEQVLSDPEQFYVISV